MGADAEALGAGVGRVSCRRFLSGLGKECWVPMVLTGLTKLGPAAEEKVDLAKLKLGWYWST